ncbi:MAG: aminopeptidase P family protein [Candidatus Krumholzibacteriia bacterium]
MTAREKVAALRKLMQANKIQAYYVPSADPHQSEYLPEAWKLRSWLSGFTGSAGELVVGTRKAGLWTDCRYYLQATGELDGSGIDLMKTGEPATPTMEQWVASELRRGQTLGMDPTTVSVAAAMRFEEALAPAGVKVKFIAQNLVAKLWTDRPEPSLAPVVTHSMRFAGERVRDKLARVRAEMAQAGCKVHVVCGLDQVAWLLNIRSRDVLFTPVATAYVLVTDRAATLYVDPRKMIPATEAALKGRAAIKDYGAIWGDLKVLGKRKMKVWIDPAAANRRIVDSLKGARFHYGPSPITAIKAVKNPVQIKHIKAAHVRDGVAMVKFLKWLEGAARRGKLTEISAAQKLTAFRAEGENYRDDSFATISGYGANGAIIHYGADEQSNAKLKPEGLYLIDSGGQYPEGTTDITRTVALGKPNRRQIECFTRVLMGTIDCTRVPFPAGTTGQRQEMFARRALWLMGEDYAHGTGHGVGQYLGVHEGPHSLKNIVTPPLVEGNLLSIEPGHYEAGGFGIRIENLAFVMRDRKRSTKDRTWLTFDTVTLCPIDTRLVDRKLMDPEQVAWLNAYHKTVYEKLADKLDPAHRKWLKTKTKAI